MRYARPPHAAEWIVLSGRDCCEADLVQERECLCGARVMVDAQGGRWDRHTGRAHRCPATGARLRVVGGEGCPGSA